MTYCSSFEDQVVPGEDPLDPAWGFIACKSEADKGMTLFLHFRTAASVEPLIAAATKLRDELQDVEERYSPLREGHHG